jgi:hypothetical protein
MAEPAEDNNEMERILNEMGFNSDVLRKFSDENISVSTVELLSDSDLESIGVLTIGARALLRKKCREMQISK